MPRAPPALLRSFGRGLAPAVKPLAIAAPVAAGGWAGNRALKAYGNARNPPLQRENLGGSTVLFDTKTGRQTTFGAPPTDKGDNERSEEEMTKWLLGFGALAAVVIVVLRGR